MRPSWGRRFSAMSSFDMIFTRETIASRYFIDGILYNIMSPPMKYRDAQFLLIRLDVDVARPLLNGGHEHHIDQPHDRRILALSRECFGADFLELFEDLDVVGASPE